MTEKEDQSPKEAERRKNLSLQEAEQTARDLARKKASVAREQAIEEDQKARLRRMRAGRHEEAVKRDLKAIEAAAAGGTNLLSPMIDAVRDRATLGEICDILRGVYGTFDDMQVRK